MEDQSQIPQHLHDKVDRELEAGERIEWMQMPVPRFFTPATTGAFLFGIPWTAFAIFWTVGAAWGASKVQDGGLLRAFPLFGVPFILIGLGMLSSPLWAHRKALDTVYVVTNRRAIAIEGGWTTTIRSYRPEQLDNVYRREKKDGSGDVVFVHRAWKDSDGCRPPEELGFLRVRDPKAVEELLRKLVEHPTASDSAPPRW